jgi:hypothetical protein
VESPYRVVLGAAFDELHPRLRAYFETIPEGRVGRGRGVFDTVGTPRRWLWPFLAPFARSHVLFPVWERAVPFTVENRPAPGGGVAAVRTFRLPRRPRTMVDEIGVRDGRLVDRLGAPVRAEAVFTASVHDGGLRLRSTRVRIMFGRFWLPIPRPVAPIVVLTERWDDAAERQAVSITVTVPLIGRVYRYAGTFRYAVTDEAVAEDKVAEDKGERSA